MSLNYYNRKLHYWGALIAALPVLIVIITGILLLLKKESSWIQPGEQRRPGKVPAVAFAAVLESCRRHPDLDIESWDDIKKIDVRPSKGILKVITAVGTEAQLDHTTGEVLQVATRRSDVIESIHDGSFFHDAAKLWVFLPAAVVLLALWVTGMVLFVLPFWVRRRQRRRRAAGNSPAAPSD